MKKAKVIKLIIILGGILLVAAAFLLWGAYLYLNEAQDRFKDNDKIVEMERRNAELKEQEEKAACAQKGGEWTRVDLAGDKICNMPTTDGGKACTDRSECQGACVGEHASGDTSGDTSGKCSGYIWVNCVNQIIKGKSQGLLCAD
ncbi:MAG: hypothetical protein Q7S09_05910 [bacterium]|nr:hypothetical protein [bacterium]